MFAEIDVDELACDVSMVPTFHIYKNAIKLDELVSADGAKLAAFIRCNSS